MRQFEYTAATDIRGATQAISTKPGSAFIAGGTGLIDLMKLDVETPQQLVDINRLPFAEITENANHGLRIGAMARNSVVAWNPLVRERYPLLSESLLAGASAQLRNMATVGGNLMQRTRCTYFRDVHETCNKRSPGSGCAAAEGHHRTHAIFGTSEHCFATHPSDMCVALVCLSAVVEVQGPSGMRRIPIEDFHKLPHDTPQIETALARDEVITGIELPPPSGKSRSIYRKVRDRASYEFALVSAAVLIETSAGMIDDVRIAFGGVATKPWRSAPAEKVLKGARADEAAFRSAAEAAVNGALLHRDNKFKVELLKRTLMLALAEVTGEQR